MATVHRSESVPLPLIREGPLPFRDDLIAQGQALRGGCPRGAHAGWSPAADRREPVALVEETNLGRVRELIPVRHGRMVQSPFAFFRGAAAIMAADLARTPATGTRVQVSGDCHELRAPSRRVRAPIASGWPIWPSSASCRSGTRASTPRPCLAASRRPGPGRSCASAWRRLPGETSSRATSRRSPRLARSPSRARRGHEGRGGGWRGAMCAVASRWPATRTPSSCRSRRRTGRSWTALERFDAGTMWDYAKLCGWALARAHGRSGQPGVISGYLGRSPRFDRALLAFAMDYADQNERDHDAFRRAVRDGRIEASREEDADGE